MIFLKARANYKIDPLLVTFERELSLRSKNLSAGVREIWRINKEKKRNPKCPRTEKMNGE